MLMKRSSTLLLFYCALTVTGFAQVKSQYQYSTTMPYGTLDIRTRISSTDYYYLKENQTFAFRESSPGVKTNSYFDMTAFDSSPYKQGHLRRKTGTSDKFVMNYRILFPNNYNATYAEGYPMIVLVHGAGERANCLYNNCYHGGWDYNPNTNSPPAPTTATHKLLNNDHNLNIGGKQHLDARNLAGTRLPNDPSMPSRAFPGFVLVAQMFNEWEPLGVQDLIRIVRLHCEKYKIDPNRVYIHGLSIGGYGVYEALKRAPWLFAAALPMSAINDASIFKHNQQTKVVHIPIWTFQGGKDTKPTPTTTNTIVNNLRNAGAIVKYTTYADLGHNVWNRAYGEADFFKWMLTQSKANIHAYKGIATIIKSKSQYPKLMLAEGFLAYQWEKNGVIISGATSNTYTATTPGTYRARFSRLSSAPSASQWNKWSAPVKVTETTTATQLAARGEPDTVITELAAETEFSVSLYPNPAPAGNVNVQISTVTDAPVEVRLVDQFGVEHYRNAFEAAVLQGDQRLSIPTLPDGIYILWVNQGNRQLKQKVMIRN
jgi:hypothetical protein